MVRLTKKLYSADQIKRDEGAWYVEFMGEGRDCAVIGVGT